MSGYILQGKKADGSMVNIDLAAKYDALGEEISVKYATKSELADAGNFDESGSYPNLTAGTATEATHAASADTATNATYAQTASTADTAGYATTAKGDEDGNDIKNTYATKSELSTKADQTALADVISGTTPVGNATNSTNATNATNDGQGRNIVATYAQTDTVVQYLGQLQDGTMAVGKANAATNDGNGQNISATYATKAETATKLNAPVVEQYNIQTTAWAALADAAPFTVSTTVTATTTIGADATIELYNDQPVAFSQYCFSIASVSGQTLTIYALETPTSAVTLAVGITN